MAKSLGGLFKLAYFGLLRPTQTNKAVQHTISGCSKVGPIVGTLEYSKGI
jgi:hypothetical protein